MSRLSHIQRIVLLFFLFSCVTPAVSQTTKPAPDIQAAAAIVSRTLPVLSATPAILSPNASITLSLPVGFVPPAGSRIALFEANRPTRIAEIRRDFQLAADGTRSLTLRVSADPGSYEWRLIANDKNRTFLTAPAPLLVPGLRREAGWWLPNGSPFVNIETPENAATPGASVQFLTGLQRDLNRKNFKPQSIATASPQIWRVLDLPPLSQLAAPGYNFATLRNQISSSGSEPLLGFALRIDSIPTGWSETNSNNFVKQLRQSLQTIAPGAALVSVFDANSDLPGNAEWFAMQTNAVVLEGKSDNFDETLWQLKALRRVAEEQPNFDLPIFIRATALSQAQQIDALLGGATGFIGAQESALQRAMQRNLPLFLGSATFEDFALWPSGYEKETDHLYSLLRDAGRIPLLGRLKNNEKEAESLAVIWNNDISTAQIEQLRKFANAGARIYIEGAPNHHEPAFNALVGADIMLRAGIVHSQMHLDDTWIFGTLRSKEIPVSRSIAVTQKPGTVAGQARAGAEKGRDVATGPRTVATLSDGSPALIINPVGKGEVIWLPHRVLESADKNLVRGYYRAIAERVQPSLVEIKPISAAPLPLRAALRRSVKGTLLLSIINRNNETVTGQATVPANATIALDLINEHELPVSSRGFASTASVSIPANSAMLIAFAPSRAELDAERFAPRLQSKLR